MEINPHAPLVTRKEIFIQASPEVVWNIHTNINGWHEWQPAISKSHLDGTLTSGSVFTWVSGGLAITSRLQEVVPQKRIGWTGRALGSRVKHIWMFRPQDGGTLVVTEESMEGWLIAILRLLMPHFLDKALDVWIKNLKTKAEGKDTKSSFSSCHTKFG